MAAILHPYRLVPTMSRQPGSEVVRSIIGAGIPRPRNPQGPATANSLLSSC